jgi:Na+/H+ antiporter NhaD/arsenite permease-like protein
MTHDAFVPSVFWVMPFACLLACLALLPLVAPEWWESNLRKLIVSAVLGGPVLALYLASDPQAVEHAAIEYVSFVILIGGLFFVAGGVMLEGDLEATPRTNLAFLGLGALLASAIGTTGASMLLVRPLLSTNQERRYIVHTVIFFIFIVSNVGGCLTALGDPPLFLGYLRGVPFTWTFRLWPEWLFANTVLLAVYFVWDSRVYQREPPERIRLDRARVKPLRLGGAHNLGLLVAVVAATVLLPSPWRELGTAAVVLISWQTTSAHLYRANRFSVQPILEVMAVFAGIFATMLPALALLRANGHLLTLERPWQYFWATGLLSTFLDNTPTYLTFLTLGQSQGLANEVVGVPHDVLIGISLGAVMMGANSYLGNGPNFMVRAIAEHRGVKMPSFGGFMLYSGLIVIPVFIVLSVVFLRG